MSLPPLFLRKGQERRVLVGHLWVYSNEVDVKQSSLKTFQAGELVEVRRYDGKTLGVAYINPASLICARIVGDHGIEQLDSDWFYQRFSTALAFREKCFANPYYRLVHSEGDFLPGLVIDRYGDYVVIQINTQGMECVKDQIVEAIDRLLSPRGILLRNDSGSRAQEGLDQTNLWIKDGVSETEIIENDTRFMIPMEEGQKTGWFYDHRENRARLRHWVNNANVLDMFSYLGGWGIQAANAGAKHVTCVDASESAITRVRQNAALNGCQNAIEAVCDDAFDALKSLKKSGRSFDVVVVDPPAFIKRKKDMEQGEQAYQRLNNLALELLEKGGILVSASCSHHLEESSLQRMILRAGRKQQRPMQIFARGDQGSDHPIHPAIPETRYIKTFFARAAD